METFASVLCVGIENTALKQALHRRGYAITSIQNENDIIRTEGDFALMVVEKEMLIRSCDSAMEKLYFLNNNVPVAVLLDSREKIDNSLLSLLRDGTVHVLYEDEIETGLIGSRIDEIYIHGIYNRRLQEVQTDVHEAQNLRKELFLRNKLLEHERGLNANILASITSGLIILDTQAVAVWLNEHAGELLHLSKTDPLGTPFTQLVPEEVQIATDDCISRIQSRAATNVIRKVRLRKQYLQFSFFRMMDYENELNGILIFINDITDQERATAQLYRTEKLATVGTMLSGIAHELRNPLAIISAWAQRGLCKIDPSHEWLFKTFSAIESQVQRCAGIVNSLLDFTRNRATTIGYHSAQEILSEAIAYVEYQNMFDNITVKRQLADDLYVLGDRSRMVQVVLNLVTNAADAMQYRGELKLVTGFRSENTGCIEIHDSGPGIDKEIAGKIFDPFFTTKEPGKGTGLGLSICYKIVQESGGSLRFHSRPGHTEFIITLPARKGPEE